MEVVILELYKEMLAHALSQQSAEIVFPALNMNATQIVELMYYSLKVLSSIMMQRRSSRKVQQSKFRLQKRT